MENLHTLKNPLILIDKGGEYRVNKPEQGSQKLVSFEVADELLAVINNLLANTAWKHINPNALEIALNIIKQHE